MPVPLTLEQPLDVMLNISQSCKKDTFHKKHIQIIAAEPTKELSQLGERQLRGLRVLIRRNYLLKVIPNDLD